MTLWKKVLITITMTFQIIVGITVAALWFCRDQLWTVGINDWLHGPVGQQFAASIGIYLALLAIITIGVVFIKPTAKPLILTDDSQNKLRIDCQIIEQHLKDVLTNFNLHKPTVKLKIHRHQNEADVLIHGHLIFQNDPSMLRTVIHHTVNNELQQNYNLKLNRLTVQLN